jgi:hypothetical protein
MKEVILTEVSRGQITHQTDFKVLLSAFEGKRVSITIENKKARRTSPQNRWYFGVAIVLIRRRLVELGNQISQEATHDLVKVAVAKYHPYLMLDEIVIPDTGKVLKRIRSTTELTTTDFMGYKEAIQQWAVEVLDIDIPDPNEDR